MKTRNKTKMQATQFNAVKRPRRPARRTVEENPANEPRETLRSMDQQLEDQKQRMSEWSVKCEDFMYGGFEFAVRPFFPDKLMVQVEQAGIMYFEVLARLDPAEIRDSDMWLVQEQIITVFGRMLEMLGHSGDEINVFKTYLRGSFAICEDTLLQKQGF